MAADMGSTVSQLFGTEYVVSMFIFTIMFNSLVLWLLTRRFAFRRDAYGYALLVTFMTALPSLAFEFMLPVAMEMYMFPVYFVLDVALIYLVYPESLKKSIETGFVWWVAAMAVSALLGLVIGTALGAIGVAMGPQPLMSWLFP
jgi:hypothetical protein